MAGVEDLGLLDELRDSENYAFLSAEDVRIKMLFWTMYKLENEEAGQLSPEVAEMLGTVMRRQSDEVKLRNHLEAIDQVAQAETGEAA
jgi:hypothetical protein